MCGATVKPYMNNVSEMRLVNNYSTPIPQKISYKMIVL